MSSRRPSLAQQDAGPQRLPFAAAEALLWGPELKKQHRWLLQQMRELTTQHEHYDARIHMVEAIAGAAEAATVRIRSLEDKITAMEAVDKEHNFETWAMAEIDKIKASQHDSNLVLRVKSLEARKKEDEDCIKSLQIEVANLRNMQQTSNPLQTQKRTAIRLSSSPAQNTNPPRTSVVSEMDVNSETEDEGLIIFPKLEEQQDRRQVTRLGNPEVEQASDKVVGPSSTTIPSTESARQRLCKRPSIRNAKSPQLFEEIQQREATSRSGPTACTTHTVAAMQIPERNTAHKPQRPKLHVTIPRLTRSQARSPEKSWEHPKIAKSHAQPADQVTQITRRCPENSKKRAMGLSPPPSPGKDPSKQPTQIVATGPRKKAKTSASAKRNNEDHKAPASKSVTRVRKPKQLIVVLPTQLQETQIRKSSPNDAQQSTAEKPNTSSRKCARKPRPCIPCTQRHRACDRTQPVCGSCARHSCVQTCVYPQPHAPFTKSIKKKSESPQEDITTSKFIVNDSGSSKRVTAAHITSRSTSCALQKKITKSNLGKEADEAIEGGQEKSIYISSLQSNKSGNIPSPVCPGDRGLGISGAAPDTVIHPPGSEVPDITEFDSFLRTKRKNPKF